LSTNEKEKILENKRKDVDLIAFHINNAVQIGNSKAATEEAEEISKGFILIRREDLPKGESRFNYSRGKAIQQFRTTHYSGLDPIAYFNRALDFLATAQYAQQVEKNKEYERLRVKREEAWKLLNPECNTMWDYTVLPDKDKAQIDLVVSLMRQVDELREKQ
jgi:hypothetical protein